MTLKIRSWSPKPNQFFIMSQCYILANLVKICRPIHEISCKQESVTPLLTPTPNGIRTKNNMSPSPFGGVTTLYWCMGRQKSKHAWHDRNSFEWTIKLQLIIIETGNGKQKDPMSQYRTTNYMFFESEQKPRARLGSRKTSLSPPVI